jgi:hypothetical protein
MLHCVQHDNTSVIELPALEEGSEESLFLAYVRDASLPSPGQAVQHDILAATIQLSS